MKLLQAVFLLVVIISLTKGHSCKLDNSQSQAVDVVCDEANHSAQKTFAQKLFDDSFSVNVRNAVLKTLFFMRIIDNTLAPEAYGGYMVQDAAYVYNAIKAFDIAAEGMQGVRPPDFALFYRGRSDGFTNYSNYFAWEWKLPNTASVNMGPAAATYAAYQMKIAQSNPKYLAIAILPCDMLWPWVAEMINGDVPQTNVYRSWVDNNLGDGSSSTQTFVNTFFDENALQTCQEMFNEGMINELNFFLSACGEKLKDYSFGHQ